MQSPRQEHWEAALRVIHYIKGQPGQGIFLHADSDLHLYAYCDSDWASCPITRRCPTGYFVRMGMSPISWKTKEQPTVARSFVEAEYRSMIAVTSKLKWLAMLMRDLGAPIASPIRLFCDSQSAIHIASNPVFHERTKHIEVDCHFVHDAVQSGALVLQHVRSNFQLADILTKAFGKQPFVFLLRKLSIHNLYALT